MNSRAGVLAATLCAALALGAHEHPAHHLLPHADSSACGRAADAVRDRARRLARALVTVQNADGAWRSQHYAMLADGPCLTAVILAGLAGLPENVRGEHADRIAKAREFLRTAVDGALAHADGVLPGYPTYGAAFALIALVRAGDASDAQRIAGLVDWLRACQRQDAHGIGPSHRAYGGWGYGPVTSPGAAGHTDLAHTRWALTALAEAKALDADTVVRAITFLALCQRRDRTRLPMEAPPPDGGFYLSPVVWPANKGGPGHWSTSYASTTADGAIALQLCGETAHANAAFAWLDANQGWLYPAGIPVTSDTNWHESVRCYHLAARAAAFQHRPGVWRLAMMAAFPEPRADGLYANPHGFLMKEDDPLVASGLLLHALAAARSATPPTRFPYEADIIIPAVGCDTYSDAGATTW